MAYTSLENIIINGYPPELIQDRGINLRWDGQTTMKPTLAFLFLTRDIVQDVVNRELSAMRLYDTLYILPDKKELIYSLNVIGRLYLNKTGTIPRIEAKLRLIDPDGQEIGAGQTLTGENIIGNIGMNLICRSWAVVFTKVGKYQIRVSVGTDSTNLEEVESPFFFEVLKAEASA